MLGGVEDARDVEDDSGGADDDNDGGGDVVELANGIALGQKPKRLSADKTNTLRRVARRRSRTCAEDTSAPRPSSTNLVEVQPRLPGHC